MDKGARVRIVKGRKGKDQTGKVFWEGPDNYKEGGTRLGIAADDGETYWVSADYVELLGADEIAEIEAATPVAPELKKGDRVGWTRGEDAGRGTVFWIGPSKQGDGLRVGLEDLDSGEALWFSARQLEVLDEAEDTEPD